MGLIGELVVKITGNTASLNKSIDSTEKKLRKLSKSAVQLGKQLTLSLTLPIVALGAAFVKAASDAEETRSKFNTVFREYAKDTEQWAKDYSKSVGRSVVENLRFLASVQDLFVPLGFARGEATEMSKSVVKLATDIASFNDLPTKDVIRDIQGAMVGMHITVRKYGVLLNEATINQELLNMGIKDGFKAATDAEKVQARLNLIIAGSADAAGDAERTIESFANQMRALQADALDLAESLGAIIIPVLKDLITAIRDWLQDFLALDEGTKKTILTILALVAALGPAIFIIGKLIQIALALKTAFLAVRTAMIAFSATLAVNPIGLVIAGIALLVGGLATLLISTTKQTTAQKNYNEELEESVKKLESIKKLAPATEAEKAAGAFLVKQVKIMKAINGLTEKNKTLRREVLAAAIKGTIIGNAEAATTQKIINQNETRIAQLQTELRLLNLRATTKKDDLEGDVERAEAIIELEQESADIIRDIRAKRAQEAIDLRNGITAAIVDANQKEIDDEKAKQDEIRTLRFQEFNYSADLIMSLASIAGSLGRESAGMQKAIALFTATVMAAQAVANVLANVNPLLWPFAIPAAIAAGAAQIVAIATTPLPKLAEGGVFTGAAIVGEAGPEVALPLTDEVFARLAAAIETAKTSGIVNQLVDDRPIDLSLGINIDGKRLNSYIAGESRNGRIIIDRSRGITKK